MSDIEHLRAVGRAATEGPWLAQRATTAAGDQIVTVFTAEDESIYEDQFANLSDAEFIATARNEWDGLLDEVERLRRWKAEAISLFDGLQDLGRALGLPLGTLITGPDAVEAAVGLSGEVARLRAKVARVEALASEWEGDSLGTDRLCAADLRAALADESAQDGLSRAGTTSVASGATGDVTGAQIGAQDEGGKA